MILLNEIEENKFRERRKKITETNPYICGHLIYDNGNIGTIGHSYGEIERLSSYFTKINFR